jgi:hypothetical protein
VSKLESQLLKIKQNRMILSSMRDLNSNLLALFKARISFFRLYLIRTSYLILIQIFELFLLIKLFYFYITPSTLLVISSLGALNTVIIIFSYGLKDKIGLSWKSKLSPSEISKLINNQIFLLVCSILFVAISFLFVLLVFTKFSLYTPSIFRAMVVSWIISLPFEAAIIASIYTNYIQSNKIDFRKVTLNLIAGTLIPLIFIATNYPIMYLLCKVGFLTYTSINTGAFNILFENRFSIQKKEYQFFVSNLYNAIITGIYELSYKILYASLLKIDPSISIPIIAFQRLSHLAIVMTVRENNLLIPVIKRVQIFGSIKSKIKLINKILVKNISLIIFLTPLMPILLLKTGIVFWLSPLEWSTVIWQYWMLILIIFLLFVHVLSVTSIILLQRIFPANTVFLSLLVLCYFVFCCYITSLRILNDNLLISSILLVELLVTGVFFSILTYYIFSFKRKCNDEFIYKLSVDKLEELRIIETIPDNGQIIGELIEETKINEFVRVSKNKLLLIDTVKVPNHLDSFLWIRKLTNSELIEFKELIKFKFKDKGYKLENFSKNIPIDRILFGTRVDYYSQQKYLDNLISKNEVFSIFNHRNKNTRGITHKVSSENINEIEIYIK